MHVASPLSFETPGPDRRTPSPSPSGQSPSPGGYSPSPDAPTPDPTTVPLTPELKEVVSGAPDFLRPLLSLSIPLVAAAAVTLLAGFIVDRLLRRLPEVQHQARRMWLPSFCLMLCLGLVIGTDGLIDSEKWNTVVQACVKVALIVCITWTLVTLVSVFERSVLARHTSDPTDVSSKLAKMRTQVTLLRRVVTAILLVLGVGGVLLMIPAVQKLGTTILASAGLVSVVVGLAVQGILSNVFAGLQVAFTNAIRVEDTVVVEGQQGTIDEITLTYVVVSMADGRNMILPSTYFTTTPFENWSRGSREMSGSVLLDLTWDAPVEWVRHRVEQLLDASELWDGRVGSVSVAGAEGGHLQLSVSFSARNAPDLATLQARLREKLVEELREKYPNALPAAAGYVPPNP